ncbi:MAG TPA: hypothetical protein ENJ04_08130 [Nitrospirae bacterium]|nr:hypothetical protein [Nitrospirota bacterium]
MRVTDIHTHGIGGFDTQTADCGDILKMAELHGRRGVSVIIPTVYPASVETMRENMAAIREAMEAQQALGGERAVIAGINLEGPFLNPSRRGALDAGAFLEANAYNLERLTDGFEDLIRIMTVAPEIEGAEGLIRTLSDMGVIVSMGHSDATYAEAERGFHAGARGITHIFNAMRGIHHREPGIAGFGLLNRDVYVEVIADPFHLHAKTIELIFSVKKPGRIIIVSDSVKQTLTSSGDHGITGGDGRLSGGCMTVTGASERLAAMGFDEEVVERCITENPGRYLS